VREVRAAKISKQKNKAGWKMVPPCLEKKRKDKKMITKTSKSGSLRNVITLLGLPFTVALMLGLAALALVLPAAASAQSPDANTVCQPYDAGVPQLYVSKPEAAKPDGNKQPLDLSIKLTDGNGIPVVGAKVLARATDFETFVDATLTDMGNGSYATCAFGYFKGSGEGAVSIHVRAEKPGYTGGANDGSNTVGRLCPVSDTRPSR
jgi:hypothetical protein